MADSDPSSEADDQEWRFDLEDVGGEADPPAVEPETVDPVNAMFFLLGVGAVLTLIVTVVL
ncbi:MAG: hypothetical protein ABEJ57_01395 [Halobacteriaceae archaeon]